MRRVLHNCNCLCINFISLTEYIKFGVIALEERFNLDLMNLFSAFEQYVFFCIL